jgi:hypothetical protein
VDAPLLAARYLGFKVWDLFGIYLENLILIISNSNTFRIMWI